jgi:twitching motility two-component system response regulator PilH
MASVLVVDDVPCELMLVKSILEGAGHSVATASSGAEALRLVSKNPPNIIILDVVMPEMSGFDVCRTIKKDPKTSSIPIILLTSKAQDSDKFWGKRQGASEYLTKPFEPKQLLAALEKLAR